jgi:hypothetical protein
MAKGLLGYVSPAPFPTSRVGTQIANSPYQSRAGMRLAMSHIMRHAQRDTVFSLSTAHKEVKPPSAAARAPPVQDP